MELLNYKTLREAKYSGYVLQDAPVRVLQFGEGNFCVRLLITFLT